MTTSNTPQDLRRLADLCLEIAWAIQAVLAMEHVNEIRRQQVAA